MFEGHFKQKNRQQKMNKVVGNVAINIAWKGHCIHSMRTEIRRQRCSATSIRNMYTRQLNFSAALCMCVSASDQKSSMNTDLELQVNFSKLVNSQT